MKKYIVKLSKEEREDLRDITYKGKHKSQKILNAQILLGEITTNYPLATKIRVEVFLIDAGGHKSDAGVSPFVLFKSAGKNEVKLYDNLIFPANNKPMTIHYEIASPSLVTIRVYDLEGNLVKTIVNNENQSAGMHNAKWWGKDKEENIVASGIYVVHIKTDFYSRTLKAAIVR